MMLVVILSRALAAENLCNVPPAFVLPTNYMGPPACEKRRPQDDKVSLAHTR